MPRNRSARLAVLGAGAQRSRPVSYSSRQASAVRRRIVAAVLVLLSIALITIYFRESSGGGLHRVQSAGATVLPDRVIGEAEGEGYGTLTTAGIIKKSSNVGTIMIGKRLGAPRFDYWVRRFGFGKPTGVDLPGEQQGIVLPPNRYAIPTSAKPNWKPNSLPFGGRRGVSSAGSPASTTNRSHFATSLPPSSSWGLQASARCSCACNSPRRMHM